MGKGGYTIIDFKGNTLKDGSDAITIKGIYAQCERALRTNKCVVCENLTLLNDDETVSTKNNINATLDFDNEEYSCILNFTFFGNVHYIRITTEDIVTLE